MSNHVPGGRQEGPGNIGGRIPGRGGGRWASITVEKARDQRGTLLRLLKYLKPHKSPLIMVFVLVGIGTVFQLAGPYLMKEAIDSLRPHSDLTRLFRIVLLMFGAYAGSWLMDVVKGIIMATFSQKILRDLRRDLFHHLQSMSLSFFDRRPYGDLMSRLTNDLDAMSRVLSENAPQLFADVLSLVGILVMIFVMNWRMALGTMIMFPIMMGLVGIVGKRTREKFRGLQRNIGVLNAKMEEMYSCQRVIMAFGQEANALQDFDRVNEAVREIGIQAQISRMLVPPLMGILSNANVAVIAGLGGWLVLKELASVGTIAAFVNYSRNFARPLRQLGNLYNELQSALAGAERVFEILDQQAEITDAKEAPTIEMIAGNVVFDRVYFSYVPDVPVIKNVNLQAHPGQIIALVGPTGAGKTTIVNILARFYDIHDGAICIDGHDIRQVQQASLRRQLGIVLQDTFLFAETVMENIRYGRLDATDEECIAAAKLANADQFIRHLSKSYQTVLSERGSNLSQGQRQLLAIARAVLANPRILILDEATSSVDTRTEIHIQKALLHLMEGRTSFVIAHRLSTIRDADVVLVINQGRIIERGTHDELLTRQGFYYNLYVSQFKGNEI